MQNQYQITYYNIKKKKKKTKPYQLRAIAVKQVIGDIDVKL